MVPVFTSGAIQVQTVLDSFAILIGIVAIFYLIRLNRKLGGKMSTAISFFNLGMVCNVLAISWATFLGHLYILAGVTFDVHHLFMTIGMIFFILSTHKFSQLMVN